MVSRANIRKALDDYAISSEHTDDCIQVHPRFVEWLQSKTDDVQQVVWPFVHYRYHTNGKVLKLRTPNYLNSDYQKTDTYLVDLLPIVSAGKVTLPDGHLLSKIVRREVKFGFAPETELNWRLIQFWDVMHWISDADRNPSILVTEISLDSIAFKFKDPNLQFEFKMMFGV